MWNTEHVMENKNKWKYLNIFNIRINELYLRD